jgi:hypothetical protein
MYTLTLGFIFPVQQIIAAESLAVIGLLFLPHGVRAVAFHYLGARAFIHLLPASYLTWFITVYGNNLDLHPLGPLASVMACYLGYLMFNAINRLKSDKLITNTWVNVLIMSAIMSILNGAALALLNFDADWCIWIFDWRHCRGIFLYGDCALHLSFYQVFQHEFRIKIPPILR